MKQTLIQMQDEYILKVNAAYLRWGHRPNGGHIQRVTRGAHNILFNKLQALGYSDKQTLEAIRDARQMAELMREYGE